MENARKLLTRIQLVNWHYFENERISLNGSTLISGENTAGKSTILDAIQLVITTNARKFNVAANEKGNRTLKGYVRCKVGNVGETYLRKGTVPANVALEFYEEKTGKYFVIGVHLLSPDEEGPVIKKWYSEECRLENLDFVINSRPALAQEFKNAGRKIRYLESDKAAKDKFRHRLGNLDEKFFDIIPKSLAFKPMDNVKEFINKFVLSEEKVDVKGLRDNIETLDELDRVLKRTRSQLSSLDAILEKYSQIQNKEKDMCINEILLKLAEKDSAAIRISSGEKDIRIKQGSIESNNEELKRCEGEIHGLTEREVALNVDIANNESSKLVESIRKRIDEYEITVKDNKKNSERLHEKLKAVYIYLKAVKAMGYDFVSAADIDFLESLAEERKKAAVIEKIEDHLLNEYRKIEREKSETYSELKHAEEKINKLRERQRELEKRNLVYPDNTEILKKAIEAEFQKRAISSRVYILAELLEITDERWRDAVEGYFNTQKFYLVVEPQYYDIALSVYDRKRDKIHTAGIINTKKIPQDYKVDNRSLAYMVKSDNRFALAYANYILGRVIRCEDVSELENHKIAITPACMLYQGYVVRHLNPKDYRDPYIGLNAYRVQLENVRQEIEQRAGEVKKLREKQAGYETVTDAKNAVNTEIIRLYMNAPAVAEDARNKLLKAKAELKNAEKDPGLIELHAKLDEVIKQKAALEEKRDLLNRENIRLANQEEHTKEQLAADREAMDRINDELMSKADTNGLEYKSAEEKYAVNRRTKEPQKIYDNFSPRGVQLENEREELLNGDNGLKVLQTKHNYDFSMDFATGTLQMTDYREAAEKLRKVEIVKYEEKLRSAKEDCERIFRSDFLSKMKEHIENAKLEFRNLNKALASIYYGDDSYYFMITFDKRKENLYRMITSENNMEGDNNLWTSAFESEYKDEIEDLFAKLMVRDDNGEKILEEYTDYRSYLDYDIEIRKRNGSKQKFSDIYGEKSGSETQVPYYVAIAASFYQLYRYGNPIRLMLLDEAFDKMDDDRIQSMMDFFKQLELQVILATPPGKIEVIGEHVDTILTAIRVDRGSIVEEYDL